jgi:DNA-binding NarL/FixJ family response regulator
MTENSRPRILIADDHALIAEAFTKLLAAEFEIVAIVHDGRCLVQSALSLRPDVILVDVGMPLLNGMQAAQRIRRELPDVKIVYVTVNHDEVVVAEAVRQGASYVLKTAVASELVTAIHQAVQGIQYVSPQLLTAAFDVRPAAAEEPHLTERQLEVLQLIAEGRSMKEVAAVLNLTTRTVAFHKYRLMHSLQLKNDAEVVQYAVRRRIVFE